MCVHIDHIIVVEALYNISYYYIIVPIVSSLKHEGGQNVTLGA